MLSARPDLRRPRARPANLRFLLVFLLIGVSWPAVGLAQGVFVSASSVCHARQVETIIGGIGAVLERTCTRSGQGSGSNPMPPGEGRAKHSLDATVGAAIQRVRDDERKQILAQELARAEAEVARLQLAAGDVAAMSRAREDVLAIRRELLATR